MKIKIILMAVALLALFAFVAFSPVRPITEAEAQNTNEKKTNNKTKRLKKAEKIELEATKGTDAEDENITGSRGKNSAEDKSTRAKPRGTGPRTCYIDLDNTTDLIIDIYVDGRFRGTMGGYDSSYTTTGSGATRIYAKAEFDDGSYLYWGPRDYKCGNNSKDGYVNFVMKLG